jgi:hypothetical protein
LVDCSRIAPFVLPKLIFSLCTSVYFKENQTPKESWQEAPSQLKVDDIVGQVHYFPAIANTEQLKANFIKHNCAVVAK